MGIVSSALFGLVVGSATWRYMRFKRGEEEFSLYNDYEDYPVPMVITHDGSKPALPWKVKPYSETLGEIAECVETGNRFEGVDLRKFFSFNIAEEDRVQYGRAVHEAHLHTRRKKRCKLYLRGDKFVLEVSGAIK